MNRLISKLFGSGYEARVLANRSPRSLFLLLLTYVFFLGMLLNGALERASDQWSFALMAMAVFFDTRVIYRVLSRAPQPEAPSLSIVAGINQEG